MTMTTTPSSEALPAELALTRALRWIDRPRDTSAWMWIGGRAGSGRTALLREVVARHPGAVHVDCAGSSAEQVARDLATALGIPATESFKGNFAAVARQITDDPIVVLANTQWAGRLRTSREPERVLGQVARALIEHHRRGLRMRLLVTEAVARVGYATLFEAFEAAFHGKPIPQGGTAARMHYLTRRGVQPSSQGEWLALWHLTLMQAGPAQRAAADQLLAAAGPVTLPWRTLWAEGVGAGAFSTHALVSRPIVRSLRIVHGPDGDLVTARTRRDPIGTWDLTTGAPRPEPDEATETSGTTQADQGPHGWRPAGAADGEVDLPRMPEYVRRGVRSGRHLTLASTDGVFVAELNQEAPAGLLKRLVGTDTTLAPAPLPAEALAPTTDWLTDVWDATAVKRFPQETLPSALSDVGAREFLSSVGFPCVTDFLELDTTGLASAGLHPVADVAEPVDAPAEAHTRYFSLGWWQGERLLLDGRDGRVLLDGSSGNDDALAGSSLSQFVAMVRLYYWWFTSDWSIEDTESDVRHWLKLIDAEAYATQGWQRVFEDFNFGDRA